jgi:phage gp29-like protein
MDAAIAKVILSQTMTTDNGSSKSQSQTHMDVREEVVKGDADLICCSFNNGPAKWLTDWNYPGATPPKVWRKIDPPEDLGMLAERDTKIYAMGFEPTEEYIQTTYGDGWVKKTAPVSPDATGLPGGPRDGQAQPPAPAFADPETSPTDAAAELALQADTLSSDVVSALIDEIKQILETSTSLQEFEQRLLTAYPKLGVKNIAAVLRDALIAAELTGRNDLEEYR